MSTTTQVQSLKTVLNKASPVLMLAALAKMLIGTVLTPLKRTFDILLAPNSAVLLNAIDATGEVVGANNTKRLPALKINTLRCTLGAVAGALAGGTDAVQAFLALDGPGNASFNTVVQATALHIGTAGNGGAVTVAVTNDGVNNGSNGGASMTQVGGAVTLHVILNTTNVADVERAIRGFGAGAQIEIKTQTTFPSYVLTTGDTFTANNLASGVDTTVAELALAGLGSGQLDTVVKYRPATIFSGNGVRVAVVPDAPLAAGSLTETGSGATATVVIHYKSATTTVAQIETLIGTSTLIMVKTNGTGATVVPNLDATMVGAYAIVDTSGTALLPPGGNTVGVAKLSDDGVTLTFPSPVGGFVISYIPMAFPATAFDAKFPS